MTGKQRALLRKMANTLDPVFQIGKGDIGEALIESVDQALEKRELIKLSVLETASIDAKTAQAELAQRLGAEPVQCIGRKFVLYRESRDHKHTVQIQTTVKRP